MLGLPGEASAADRIAKAFFVDPPSVAPEKVFLVAPEQPAIEIPLPSRVWSQDIILPKGDLVFAVLPRVLAEDEVIPKEAPKVRIPAGWSRCYLLFTVETSNKFFPLKVTPINGSSDTFPIGDSRIVNLSHAMVKGKFGKQIVTISPGTIENLDPPIKEYGAYPVVVYFMMRGDKAPQPLARTNWQHNPQSRQVVLITKPDGVKYPRFRVLQDRVPVEEELAPPQNN